MSFQHHDNDPMFPGDESELIKRFKQERNRTAPREYPDGRLNGDDEGSLTFKIGPDAKGEKVMIEFSHETVWVGMAPQQAVELAQMLIKHALAISKEPIRVVMG